jgi:hypothetical protein
MRQVAVKNAFIVEGTIVSGGDVAGSNEESQIGSGLAVDILADLRILRWH